MTMVMGPLVLGLLAGCAPRVSSVSAPAAPAEGHARGTILAVRPALPGPSLPGLPTGRRAGSETQATEFIIRLDGAGTISVVQPGTPGFRPADRVLVLAGPPARLARLD
jgi:hypothetical protein